MSYSKLYSQYMYIKSQPNMSGEIYGRCPFHDDTDPSFSFSDETGLWYCFTCEDGGTPEHFIHLIEDVDYSEASQIVREKMGQPTLPSNEQVHQWQERLQEAPSIMGYLFNRGINDTDLIKEYELGWDGERLILPVRNEKDELANLRRLKVGDNDGPKAKNWPGFGKSRLWPMDQLEHDEVLICAGEIDTLSAIQQGYNAVTGTSGETVWPKKFNKYFNDKTVYIVYDGDQTGQQASQDLAVELNGHAKSVYVAHLPEGEDTNSLHQQGTKLDKFLNSAVLVGAPGPRLLTGPELVREIESAEREPWLIEDMLRLGWLGVLGGHAKGGKTTITAHLSRIFQEQGNFLGKQVNESVPVMYVSYEMDMLDLENMYTDIVSENPVDWPFILLDPPRPLEPDELQPFLGVEPGVCFIDSATPAFGLRGDAENQSSEIGYYLRGLQDLARRSGWAIIVIHHLTKTAKGNSILDLRGAGEWTAAPDLLMIWSDGDPGQLLLEGRMSSAGNYDATLDWDTFELEGETVDRHMSETAEQVDNLLVQNPGLTCGDITKELGMSKSAVWQALTTEHFLKLGKGQKGDPYRWFSPENQPKSGRDYEAKS